VLLPALPLLQQQQLLQPLLLCQVWQAGAVPGEGVGAGSSLVGVLSLVPGC
jgi:hypothetical protein